MTDDELFEKMLTMEHPVSKKYPQMSMEDRSAQFAPFAALTGLDETMDRADRDMAEKMSTKHNYESEDF
ncbi:MAG: hypothetical protein BWY61_00992 [Firmicutes bacterium ADurb.Bin354]|nr:MAG: hypothetical protein BWY61_00992 [Firmicutes bacterium ADurb.Bin354]SCY06948.1 hypothetical protein SAMN02910370_01202 [Lachnospiraceae bacterium XPB1003]